MSVINGRRRSRRKPHEGMDSVVSFVRVDIDVIVLVEREDYSIAEKTWVLRGMHAFDACSKMRERFPQYGRILCVRANFVAAPVTPLFEALKPGVINSDSESGTWGIIADREGAAVCRNAGPFEETLTNVSSPRLDIDSKCLALYVSNHDDESEAIGRESFGNWPYAIHVRIPTTPILENVQYCSDFLLSRRSEWKNRAFVGTIAYSAMRKLRFRGPLDFSTIPARTDVIAMYPGDNRRDRLDLVEHGEAMHRGFARVWTLVMDALGVPEASRNPEPFFSNYFMMAPRHFEYFCMFMKHAWKVIQERDDVRRALYLENATYPGRQSGKSLMNLYGVPWYPFMTFVMERLCPVFCSVMGLEVYFCK